MAAPVAREFVEGWTLADTLGEGAYGEVKLVINHSTGEAVAMKMVDLKKHPDAKLSVRKEVMIQKMLQDKHVLRFFGTRTQGDVEYIFLEYAAGGELFDRIEPDIGMESHAAQRYFLQLLSGVEYLHKRGVAHRDIKPENLLLDEHDNIKISDFGMATMFRMKGSERLLDKRCGTLPYVAPEILENPYKAEPADLWSCGIVLVAMLAGELPWDQPTESCLEYSSWLDSRYSALTPWSKLDTSVLSLLRRLLAHDPQKRLTVKNIKEHRWCTTTFSLEEKSKSAADTINNVSKRLCVDNVDGKTSPVYFTQPEKNLKENMDNNSLDARSDMCFSQPTLMDDMFLSTQLHSTQGASQNPFQKLVKRMTRFFVSSEQENALRRLCSCLEKQGYVWKANEGCLTITTTDCRKMQLVFKANIIEMDGKILIDFRLSKGCGLEFKRRFVRIKETLSDIIIKGPLNWPT